MIAHSAGCPGRGKRSELADFLISQALAFLFGLLFGCVQAPGWSRIVVIHMPEPNP